MGGTRGGDVLWDTMQGPRRDIEEGPRREFRVKFFFRERLDGL